MEVGELHRHLVVDGHEQVLPGLQLALQVLAVLVGELRRSCGQEHKRVCRTGLRSNSEGTPKSGCSQGLRNALTMARGTQRATVNVPPSPPFSGRTTVLTGYDHLLLLTHVAKYNKGT